MRSGATAPASESAGQLTRYVIVGACGYLLAMALYAVEIAAGVDAYVAVPPVFVANGLFNFFLNRHWSFPRSGLPLRTELGRFCVVAVGSLAVNYTSLYLLHGVAGLPPVPAQALAIVIATPVGFLGNKLWSFNARPASQPGANTISDEEATRGLTPRRLRRGR
jgi:putative flippase GtrA